MDSIQITVPGEPVGKGRPRVTARGGVARAYTPAKTREYESLVSLRAEEVMCGKVMANGAIAVSVDAVFEIPRSWAKWKKEAAADGKMDFAIRVDIDNVIKSVLDGMIGVVFDDDKQVTKVSGVKKYGTEPGVTITVTWES